MKFLKRQTNVFKIKANRQEILLPVAEPLITTYTTHAYLFSVLGTKPETLPWIYGHYIHIYINKNYLKNPWGNFYFQFPYELSPVDYCKWIRVQKIDRSTLQTSGELLEFIADNLQNGYYIRMMLNYAYLTITDMKCQHDIFIHGIHQGKKTLRVSDFFVHNKYSVEETGFEEFLKAYTHLNLPLENDPFNGMIHLYKLKNNCDYRFHTGNIRNGLHAYLTGRVPEYWEMFNYDNRAEIEFGIKVYDVLCDYLMHAAGDKSVFVDVRPFYLLQDHKKLMLLRLKYLVDLKLYKTECPFHEWEELISKGKTLIILLIKYNVTKNSDSLLQITGLLKQIKEKEEQLLTLGWESIFPGTA